MLGHSVVVVSKEWKSNSIIQDNWSVWSRNFTESLALIGQVKILLLSGKTLSNITNRDI